MIAAVKWVVFRISGEKQLPEIGKTHRVAYMTAKAVNCFGPFEKPSRQAPNPPKSSKDWKYVTKTPILTGEGELLPTRPSPGRMSGQRPFGSSVDPNEVPR